MGWRDWQTGTKGFDVLILGQERSGKTTFYSFLRLRILGKDGQQSQPTIDNVNSGVFSFEWTTDNGTFGLAFRNVGDRSGQIGPQEHAKMLIRRRPHLTIIVLDITSSEVSNKINDSYKSWFEYFCSYVSDLLINRPKVAKRFDNRPKTMLILLNKTDLLLPADLEGKVERATKIVRDTMGLRLTQHLGGRVTYFPILPCSMVENPKWNGY